MIAEAFRYLHKPAWISVVLVATIAAAGAALWMGLQQQADHTATTHVFSRRVGYLDRPVPELEDHIGDIVNAVEFPAVFIAIEERTLLLPEEDYTFTIEQLDDEDSIVEIRVEAARAGDAERISRILVEEVVEFVLDGQRASLDAEIADLEGIIATLQQSQADVRERAFGVPPDTAIRAIELSLLRQTEDSTLDEEELLGYLSELEPLADRYRQTTVDLNSLYRDLAAKRSERADVVGTIGSVNEEWYRSVSPVERASNVPVAIAMAFAAGIPAVLVAALLVTLNLNRRLTGHLASGAGPRPQPA